MDCSLSGSSVHGIFQARILEWVAIPSPGDLPDPGIEPESPALAHVFFTTESPEKLIFHSGCFNKIPDDLAASSPRTAGAGSSKLHSLHMHCVRDAFFWHFCLAGSWGFPGGKESACHCRKHKRFGFDPWVRKIPSRRKWQPTSVFLPGESHRQRSLARYSPWGRKESDMAKATSHACKQDLRSLTRD